jgi:branched-chain amino acid transport system substrate-binding protein
VTLHHAVALISESDAAASERLERTVQAYGVPLIVTGDLPTTPTGTNVFCLDVDPAKRGERLGRFAVENLKANKVVLVADDRSEGATALAKAFSNLFRRERPASKGGTCDSLVFSEDVQLHDLTARAAAANPEVVVVAASIDRFVRVRTQLAATKQPLTLLYGGADEGVDPLLADRDPGPDVDTATVFAPGALTPTWGGGFNKMYQERYDEPPDFAAVQSYDAVRLLIDALTTAQTTTPAKLCEELGNVDKFDSLTGPLSLKDHRTRRRVFIASLKAGEAKLVRTFNDAD